jgi:histidine triad (HIT) family protein
MNGCLFCKMAKGEIPCHEIWQDADHLAFLTIFPNTAGFSVVIPKQHYSSYVFDLDDDVLSRLVRAAKQVGKKIDRAFPDVGRTGLIFEGFGVDHVHAKLFPMHGTADMKKWQPLSAPQKQYFEQYEGYISSHDAARANDQHLVQIAAKIRRA